MGYLHNRLLHDDFNQYPGATMTTSPRSALWRPLLGLLVLLFWGVVYWNGLLSAHQAQVAYAEEQTRLRAQQMSMAFAQQVGALVSGFEYLAHSLAIKLSSGDEEAFKLALRAAEESFPQGSLTQIAVADAHGVVTYSSLNKNPASDQSSAPVSIADREHFRVHVTADAPELFVSRPVFGRVSGKWTVQFSCPVHTNGVFSGVVVLSVAPNYLSRYFREIFSDDKNVALLVRSDGSYLARSSQQDVVMDKSVKPTREFLHRPDLIGGEYFDSAVVDGHLRYYAWHRVPTYPLVVSVGLDRDTALMSTLETIQASRERSMLGTLAILIAGLWILFLFDRQRRQGQALAASKARLALALEGGGLGSWTWDVTSNACNFDQRWCQILGLSKRSVHPHFSTIRALVHPDDLEPLQADIDAHLSGEHAVFESEHRMRHVDGSWRWVQARGRITHRANDGRPLRLAGTQQDITERRRDEAIRAELQQRLTKIAAQLPGCVYQYRLSADGRWTFPYASPSLSELLLIDIDTAERDASAAFEPLHPDDRPVVKRAFRQSAATLSSVSIEFRICQPDGSTRWLAACANPEREEDGSTLWHGYVSDITERRLAQDALHITQTQLTEVIRHFPGGVLVEDAQGRILIVNQTLCALLNAQVSAEALIGTSVDTLRNAIHDPHSLQLVNEGLFDAPSNGHRCEVQFEDGRMLKSHLIQVSLADEVFGRLWIVHDITAYRQHERMLQQLATTDALTGLANRRAFMAYFESELHRIDRGGVAGMLLMLDLDHFKRVNDTYGHAAGDDVLVALANLMRDHVRRGDMPARLGGEEFAVLLPATAPDAALALAERLRQALAAAPIMSGEIAISVTTSIGAAQLSGLDAAAVLARADAALYDAKHQGRNRVVLR